MGIVNFLDRKQNTVAVIFGFNNDNSFLSNFESCSVILPAEANLPEMDFDSVENAYMAWKTLDYEQRLHMQAMSASEVKNYSIDGKISLRSDYSDEGRLQIMEQLLRQKFSDKNPELKQKLIDTGDIPIIEANDLGDVFFGFCYSEGYGYGMNHLGCLLMQIRQDISCTN